jgi:hypothetical protein
LSSRPGLIARRSLLASVPWLLAGCPHPVAREREIIPPPLPDVEVARVTDLLTSARLEWLVTIRPAELSAIDWLKPSLARVFKDERLDLLAAATGIQLRDVPELALASYPAAAGDSAIAYFVRHGSDPLLLERKFRERLTADAERTLVGHQLLTMWGLIGRALHGFVSIGPHVVGYQYGGDKKRGPARIAVLYAQHKLDKVPAVLGDPVLGDLDRRLGNSPAKAFLAGPFEGAMARGARGLFGAATGAAAALAPTPKQTLALQVVLGGSFPEADAPRYLEGAWTDLGKSDLGNLLGLSKPRAAAEIKATAEALELHTEIDAALLLDGLSAATSDSIKEIMR